MAVFNKKLLTIPLYQEGGFNGYGEPIFSPDYGEGGQPTDPPQFFYPGDPFSGTGWRDIMGADKRFLVNTGPFNLPAWEDLNGNGRAEPGEPGMQEILWWAMLSVWALMLSIALPD